MMCRYLESSWTDEPRLTLEIKTPSPRSTEQGGRKSARSGETVGMLTRPKQAVKCARGWVLA